MKDLINNNQISTKPDLKLVDLNNNPSDKPLEFYAVVLFPLQGPSYNIFKILEITFHNRSCLFVKRVI